MIEETIKNITKQNPKAREKAKERLEQLTMPHWALGRIMDLSLDLAGMMSTAKPTVERKTIVTMAGDHGVCEEGVSAYPAEVTPQMVYNFVAGGAGVNALARVSGSNVVIVDMGVAAPLDELVKAGKIIDKKIAMGTKNIAKGEAMTREQAIEAIEAGIEVAKSLAPQTDIFGTGEMGIGNTTPSTAIAAILTDASIDTLTGKGTGINEEQREHKVSVIEKSIEVNKPNKEDGIDIVSKIGGFEIAGLAGLMLGAASLKKPVMVDGFISTAAALIAQVICPNVTDYLIAAHQSEEQGHGAMLKKLDKQPLLDFGMRLGEGSGAALAMTIAESAVRVLKDVATFAEAEVSESL